MQRRGLFAMLGLAPLAMITKTPVKAAAQPVRLDLPGYGDIDWQPKLERAFREMEAALNRLQSR